MSDQPRLSQRTWALLWALRRGRARLGHLRWYDPEDTAMREVDEDVCTLMDEGLLDRATRTGNQFIDARVSRYGRYWLARWRKIMVERMTKEFQRT